MGFYSSWMSLMFLLIKGKNNIIIFIQHKITKTVVWPFDELLYVIEMAASISNKCNLLNGIWKIKSQTYVNKSTHIFDLFNL